MELKDKKVLVTGASSGIGKAIAIACAKENAYIYINYKKNETGAKNTLQEVSKYSKGEIIQADLTKRASVVSMFDEIGSIDVLVNNAGEVREGDIFDSDVWEYEHKIIFLSALYCIQQFLAQPLKKPRKIISITSLYGNLDTGNAKVIAYSVYKSALNSLTKNVAKFSDSNTQVNAIAPGYTWTPFWEGTSDEEKKDITSDTNIKRFVLPEEIAQMAVAILENDAIHGEIITIDGGESLQKNT